MRLIKIDSEIINFDVRCELMSMWRYFSLINCFGLRSEMTTNVNDTFLMFPLSGYVSDLG